MDNKVFENAKYIKAEKSPRDFNACDPAPVFRKEFTLDSFGEGQIYIQSPGFARVFINGYDVTDDLFISPVSDYTKILWYNRYDVTRLLKTGENTIFVIAGNGFLNESFRTAWDFDTAPWRDAPQFILRLEVDGNTALVSDKSWKCSREKSHVVFNHLRSGEYWDMRKKDDAPMAVGYDDMLWQYAVEKPIPQNALLLQTLCQPIRECEKILPKSIVKTPRGYLVDFGVNMSGYAGVTLCEKRGREIVFTYSEEIDRDLNPDHNGMDSKKFYPESPFQVNKMIASGNTDRFKPMFCYHGFRYMLIEGLSQEPDRTQIVAYFTHHDIKRISTFESGNGVLNFIYNAGIRSTYSNMFWCITDCPTREKLGWMNDAQASTEQTLINFDILPLYEKWYTDILLSMFEDGSLHGTVPAPDWPWGHRCGPVCDCMLFELPYRIYLYTGKKDMLKKGLPYFERYIAFLEKKISEGYEFILDDWTSNVPHAVPKRMIALLCLLKAYTITAFADGGKSGRCDNLKKAIAKEYTDADGRCIIEQQTAVAMLMRTGIGNKEILAKQLVSIIERDNCQLKSGMVGIQYIFYALSDIGRGDIACRLLTDSIPGYRSWFESGATTLWENWDGEHKNSHNHHMYSGVIAWLFKCLVGISPKEDAPAFERIDLKPCFLKYVGFANATMQTVRGEIKAGWRYTGDGFAYTVSIPDGVSATFYGKTLECGTNEFFVSEDIL